jgi:hypothetical protein
MSRVAELVHTKDIQPTVADQRAYTDVVDVVRVVQLEENGGPADYLWTSQLVHRGVPQA